MTASPDNPFGPSGGRRRRVLQGLALILTVAVAATAILWFRGRAPAPVPGGHQHGAAPGGEGGTPVVLSSTEQRRIGVTFAPVRSGPVRRTVRIVGLVKEDETRVRTVTTRVEGFVEELQADFTGQLVRAGQTLLGLYAPAAVSAQTELLLAIGLERRLGSGDPESFRSAHYSVEAARQRLRWWSVPEAVLAEVERSGTVQRVFPLQTPWSGFVLEKNVVLGQRVMAGDPLYRLADLGVVWVEGEVFEQDLSLIRVGALVSASFQALPGTERQGRVTYIYPTIDLTTRTARIRVEFDNHQFVLKPGMYGTLQLETEIASGLSIPRSAIVATGTRNLVFLKRGGGRFEPREVTLGAGTGDRVHVLAGLAMGDTVVASATFLMDAESNLGSMLSGMGAMPGMDVAPSDTGAGSGTELPDHRMEDMTDMKGTDSARRSPARPAKRPPPASHQR